MDFPEMYVETHAISADSNVLAEEAPGWDVRSHSSSFTDDAVSACV